MLRRCRFVLPVVFTALLTPSVFAAAPQSASPPVAKAGVKTDPITLDGMLDEAAWKTAPGITLVQQKPHPGQPTPFITTVRILRGKSHVYFGIRSVDPDPAKIAIHTLQRDGDQSGDDNVMLVLDTFDQHKLAYVFQVNAGGAMADGLISPGYDNPDSNTPAVDYDWNGYWKAAVKRMTTGWTAEIRIDTQSLQFDSTNVAWGLNLSRYVPRDQLTLAWSGINLNASPTNLQWDGTLTGIQGLSQGSGFEFDPHVVAEYNDTKQKSSIHTGFDAKYNFTPGLAARFTWRPDFSQAQANSQQIDPSPYAQPIPETRAFFLEGANIFAFGRNLGSNFIPFYSRNVGLINGATVPVDEGVKLLGHADGWTLGVLDTQMAGTSVSDATNLFAGRAVYNVNDQWRVGTLVTHGDPLGKSDNTLVSLDSTWSTSTFAGDKNLKLSGWAARSSGNDAPDGSPVGYGFDVEYPNDLWHADANYNVYGSALNPALGFIQRPGTKQTYVDVFYQPRPNAASAFSWVRQFFLEINWTYVTDPDNRVQTDDWHFHPIAFTTQSGWQWDAQIEKNHEVLSSPYAIVPGVTVPAGAYNFTSEHVGAVSPTANALGFNFGAQQGGIYNGHYKELTPAVTFAAPGGHFTSSLSIGRFWVYTPNGNGILRFSELKLGYSFKPGLTLSSLTQYNNISDNVSENAILQWNIQPARTLYVVWNHGLTLNPNLLQGTQTITGNTTLVKLAWGFY